MENLDVSKFIVILKEKFQKRFLWRETCSQKTRVSCKKVEGIEERKRFTDSPQKIRTTEIIRNQYCA